MKLQKWDDELGADYEFNNVFNESFTIAGINIIRDLIDRTIDFSVGEFDWFGDAYIDDDGREDSVDTGTTTASFDTNKYTTTASATSYVYHDIPAGTFTSTATSAFCSVLIEDWETGASIQYELITYNITSDSKTLDYSGQTGATGGMFIKSDGTKIYIVESTGVNQFVFQYTMSTPWDMSTATYDSKSYDVAGDADSPRGLFFNDDGTKMYVMDSLNDQLVQFILSTAWNVSTASHTVFDDYDISNEDNDPNGIFFKSDGLKFYFVGHQNSKVYQYSVSPAWDVDTNNLTYDSKSFDFSSQDTTPSNIFFSSDGTTMFMQGETANVIYQYTLGTAWDVSTATYDSKSYDVNSIDNTIRGLFFKSDGSKLYFDGNENDLVYQYSLGISWDIEYEHSTGLLDINEVSDFTDFVVEPKILKITLTPKSSSPTAGYPSIKGVALRVT